MPDRPLWFRRSDDGGVYTPVHRNGCLVFAATVAWIIACGIVGMLAFLYTRSPSAFAVMVAAVVPALLLMARTIRRLT